MDAPAEYQLLLRDWQRFYARQLPPPAEHNCDLPEFWAAEKLNQLAHHEPDTAWLLILQLLRQQLPDNAFANLAAGPMEDLLQYHGEVMIDRIEAEAKSNPEFRRLLGGVWRSGPAEVWARVEHVRGEVW